MPYGADPSASFEYAVTWIMSQRILIHPRGTETTVSLKRCVVTEKLPDARTDQTSVVLSQLPSSRAVMSALRFDKGPKHQSRIEQRPGSQDEFGNTESDFDLQVRIDKSIVVDARAQDKGAKDQDIFWDQV